MRQHLARIFPNKTSSPFPQRQTLSFSAGAPPSPWRHASASKGSTGCHILLIQTHCFLVNLSTVAFTLELFIHLPFSLSHRSITIFNDFFISFSYLNITSFFHLHRWTEYKTISPTSIWSFSLFSLYFPIFLQKFLSLQPNKWIIEWILPRKVF